MRPWTLAVAIAALVTAVWWHLPVAAQRAATQLAARPAANEPITFEQYAISGCAIWRSAKPG